MEIDLIAVEGYHCIVLKIVDAGRPSLSLDWGAFPSEELRETGVAVQPAGGLMTLAVLPAPGLPESQT
jgi:hypothetical protein